MSVYGIFVKTNDDGTVESSKVKQYQTYNEMINDTTPGKYGIVLDTNTVYHKSTDGWVVGFPNIVKEDDYTAFEVCPHSTFIRKGTKLQSSIVANAESVIKYLASLESDELRSNAAFDYNIEASMIHEFTLRSKQLPNEMDVVVDWGDGTVEKCATTYIGTDGIVCGSLVGGPLRGSVGNYMYMMRHEYATEGIHTVKIYGKNYFAIIPNKSHQNITCSALSENLPVASHINNFSSFCYAAKMMVYVNVYNCGFNAQVQNASNMFYYCLNLKKAVGFTAYSNMKHCGGIFGNCYALQHTNLTLPSFDVTGSNREAFYRCWALADDINDLLPSVGFISNEPIQMLSTFYECKSLTGTVPVDKLWGNTKVSFRDTSDCFSGCHESILAQVPESWGGTLTE